MSDKITDQKKQILTTAAKLFSTKGFHLTSMQEIAEISGISKGSMYLHFRSKDELLLSIFKFYFQQIKERILLIERDVRISAKDKFIAQLEAMLHQLIDFHDFYTMQDQDKSHIANKAVHAYMREIKFETLEWAEKTLCNVYGEEIKPYATDCALLLNGLMMPYLRLIYKEQIPLDLTKTARFIVRQMDYIVVGLLRETPAPLVSTDVWNAYQQYLQKTDHPHPLVIVKYMKDNLESLPLELEQFELAYQTLHILEQELMEVKPRTAIMRGMLGNLKELKQLEPLTNKLNDSIYAHHME